MGLVWTGSIPLVTSGDVQALLGSDDVAAGFISDGRWSARGARHPTAEMGMNVSVKDLTSTRSVSIVRDLRIVQAEEESEEERERDDRGDTEARPHGSGSGLGFGL
jgi:hypothetical protein